MKKRIFRHVTQTGAKLLLSVFALLLLTGCNVPTPTPPDGQEPTGTEQPTERPTEQPTEQPTESPAEQPTEEVTTVPDPVEARYDAFLAILEASRTEKKEYCAETYVQAIPLSWWYSLDVTVENGEIYLGDHLYECTFVEGFQLEFDDGSYTPADKSVKSVLDRMKNWNGYYVLQNESFLKYGEKVVVVELDHVLYFLALATGSNGRMGVLRVHTVDVSA